MKATCKVSHDHHPTSVTRSDEGGEYAVVVVKVWRMEKERLSSQHRRDIALPKFIDPAPKNTDKFQGFCASSSISFTVCYYSLAKITTRIIIP